MIVLFLQSVGRFFRLLLQSLWPPRDSAARRHPRRVLLMLAFLPLLGLVQLVHWLGFLLDEILFRGYRRVAVEAPVFVTGVPRSGTTMLHRVIAADEQFTTFSTWECLFAPSVTERRVIKGIARVDGWIGKPLARLVRWLEAKAFAGLDDIHDMSLTDAEEDYFVFTALLSCFILVVPFPYADWIWNTAAIDRSMTQTERKRVMQFYHRCVQRHLYAHGQNKRFLSKNASFAPFITSLLELYPDARFVLCLRDPLEVVPSQLSSLTEGMEFFVNNPYDVRFRDRLIGQLSRDYRAAIEAPIPPGQGERVAMRRLKSDLAGEVTALYRKLGLQMSARYGQRLIALGTAANEYRSRHEYRLGDFGLDEPGLREAFADVYAALPADISGPAGSGGR